MSKHVGEKCGKLWLMDGDPDGRTDKHHHTIIRPVWYKKGPHWLFSSVVACDCSVTGECRLCSVWDTRCFGCPLPASAWDSQFFGVPSKFSIKICYDKAGNLPNKGRNFNTQTWGKIVYFLFVWLVGIGFRQNFFRVLPNFGDFGAKMSFFHYIINQNWNNFIKHCPPPRVPRSRWYQSCVSI